MGSWPQLACVSPDVDGRHRNSHPFGAYPVFSKQPLHIDHVEPAIEFESDLF